MAKDNSSKALSTVALNALKPGQTLTDVKEHRGLRVVCGASGVKTFQYRFRSPADGKIKQIKLGRYLAAKAGQHEVAPDQLTLAEARVKFLELKALRDSGVCPVEKAEQERLAAEEAAQAAKAAQQMGEFTVKKLVDTYLAACIDGVRTKKGAAEVRRALYGDAVKVLGEKAAADVTTADVFDMIMEVVKRGANVQAGFILRELTAAYDHAIDGLLPENHVNPCYQAKGRLKRKRVRLSSERGTRVLNDGELSALLKWLPGSRFTPGQKGVLNFTLMTGCRTGEACAVRWEDIDLKAGVWYLKETKTGVPRNVQLTTQAVEFLKQQRRMSDTYVFSQVTGNSVQQKTLTERMWHMRTKELMLNIPAWSPHDLRRSVATGLARMGCPAEVVEAVLGHTKGGIEGVYNLHRYEQECREWLQRWCDHLDTLNSSEKIVPMGVRHG